MRIWFPGLLFFLISVFSLNAATKYASPSGSSTNSGNEEGQAWSLEYALGLSSPLAPGDSLILVDGTYEGNYTSNLNGSEDNPIIVISQSDGGAIIDVSKNRTTGTGLIVRGSYTWFIGLRITSSSTIRNSDASNGFADILYESGVTVFGDNIKIINCWIYDLVGGGVELWRNGFNNEVYGSVVFNNGSQAPDRGTGHGFYIQHADPTQPKIIENNIVFQNASQGINLYTTNPENLGIKVIRNVSFNSGVIADVNLLVHRPPHNFTVGSRNNISSEMEIKENIFYRDLQGFRLSSAEVSNVTLGRTYSPNKNISFTENTVFGGGNQVEIQPLEGLVLKSNRLYNVHGNFYAFLGDKSSFPGADWNSNSLYNIANFPSPFNGLNFQDWKDDFGFDLNSEFKSFPAQQQEILVTQNKYEPSKFYVTIISLNDASSAVIDFSNFSSFKGRKYEIIDFQNPFDTEQRVSGTYDGNTLQFPLNWNKSLQPKGNMPFPVVHTDLTFGTFLLKFEELENLENPILKENITLYLDEEGKVQIELSDLLESYGTYLPEEFTLSQNELSCSDIPEASIEINAKKGIGVQEWSEITKIYVLDTISPTFSFNNANLAFDLVIGSVNLDGPDFAILDPADNCSNALTLEFDKYEITCADINEESGFAQVPVQITIKDDNNNSTVVNAFANLNVFESKKVSLENTVKLFPGQNAEIKLGDELGYEVLEWQKFEVEIPGETSRTLEVSEEGIYRAKLRLESGCIVYSKIVEVKLQELPYPTIKEKIELSLNEEGIATLKPEDIFETWPLEDETITIDISKTEFLCTDLGENRVLVTLENSDGTILEVETIVTVRDLLPPGFVEKFTPVSFTFDRTVGELVLDPEDFFDEYPSDNCGSEGITIELSQSTITCADVDSERENYPVTFEITVSDASGNARSFPATANLNLVESIKVSITSEGVLYPGSEVNLQLGAELDYEVIEWRRNTSLVSGQTGKTLAVSEPGVYSAVLRLASGCLVSSESIEIKVSEVPYPPVLELIELSLDENGLAELSAEDVFSSWPLGDPNLEIVLSLSSFNCEDLGENQITITIKNEAGTEWVEESVVKVEDKLPPVIVTKDIEVVLDRVVGSISLNPEDFIESIRDNCEIEEVTLNKTELTCEDIGKEFSVELRVVDTSGNVTESLASIRVTGTVSSPVSISGEDQICEGETSEINLSSEA
uniref:right-handed parallel beta-helix repeat-containing protein n=1 Tax=Algoriphagus sp. TaxID=1872435 RepID=UPI0025F25552